MQSDILIVGAGPAGLSMATALATQRISALLVDPAGEDSLGSPADDGREIALTPLSRDLLQAWEQWPLLGADETAPLCKALVFDGKSSRPMSVEPRGDDDQLGWMVANQALRRVAFARARSLDGIDWRLGHKVVSTRRDKNGAEVELDDGQRIETRLIIAADSRFSSLRREAGIGAAMHDFGRSMLVCRMRLEHPQTGVAWEWLDYGQTLALLPLNDNLASVVITLPPADIARLCSLSIPAFEEEVVLRFDKRLGAMHLEGGRFAYPLVGVHPERCVAERLACIGDAAVGMHPITAHGYNLALRGIALLTARLAEAHARNGDVGASGMLEAFQHEFRAATRPLYLATQAIARLYGDDRPPSTLLRRAGLRLGQHFAPFRTLLGRALGSRDPRPALWMRAVERTLWRQPRNRSD